jgi:hypothetical protein
VLTNPIFSGKSNFETEWNQTTEVIRFRVRTSGKRNESEREGERVEVWPGEERG